MYKWQVQSAIAHGGRIGGDMARVADGISASLRQFSISLSRAGEEGDDRSQITRAQRSANAFKEVSSLTPQKPRGIDARSLAANPPEGFTIRRVMAEGISSRVGGRGYGGQGRGGLRGRGASGRGRGGAVTPNRGGGRIRGVRKPRGARSKVEAEPQGDEPLTPEEQAYFDGVTQGLLLPYTPKLSLESLDRLGPAVATNSALRGLTESVIYKMQVGTNNLTPAPKHSALHLAKLAGGNGTLFENDKARAVTEAFKEQKARKLAAKKGRDYVPVDIGAFSEAAKTSILNSWVGGKYSTPAPAKKEDIMGQVEVYTTRNETYLPADSRQMQEKLLSLLPLQARPLQKPAEGTVKRPL